MKKLIIIRHGNYTGDDLDAEGIIQIESAALKIGHTVDKLVCTNYPRTLQSAEIFMANLIISDTQIDRMDIKEYNNFSTDCDEFLNSLKVKYKNHDVVVLFCHAPNVSGLLGQLLIIRQEFKGSDKLRTIAIDGIVGRGEPFAIDFEEMTIRHFE